MSSALGKSFVYIFTPVRKLQLSECKAWNTPAFSLCSFLCSLFVFGHVLLRVTLWHKLGVKVIESLRMSNF